MLNNTISMVSKDIFDGSEQHVISLDSLIPFVPNSIIDKRCVTELY